MNDDRLFQELLRELFQGHSDRLRPLLRPLTAEQRKALLVEFGELLKVLHRACRYQQDARLVKLADLYEAIRDDREGFLREQADKLAAPGALNNSQVFKIGLFQQFSYSALQAFYHRLNLLQAGLANKAAVVAAFKVSSQKPVRVPKFILHTGRVLLERPEPWVGDALARVFEHVLKPVPFSSMDQGITQLMLEAYQQHPEWAAVLAPYRGMAMRRDGFFNPQLAGIDADMILAGLEYEPPTQEGTFEPLLDGRVVETLLQRVTAGDLPRAELLALILVKLQSPLRPSVAKYWLDFFDRLRPTEAEICAHRDRFIDLLNAPTPVASKLGFQRVEQYFLDDASQAMALLNAFGYGLRHPTQALAKSALRLLKKLTKRHPDSIEGGLCAAIGGLSSPHALLRSELLRWIGTVPSKHFGEEIRQSLQDAAAALPASELGPIAHLLAQAPPGLETDLTEAPDGRRQVLAAVDALRHCATAHPEESVWQQRLAFLEAYLATGHCGELVVKTPDHATALSPLDFHLHGTAEEVALDIARTQNRVFGQADYDRIFAGMVRFAKAAHSERVSAILAPLLDKQSRWEQSVSSGGSWGGQGGELPALCMARVWRGEAVPRFDKNSRGGGLLDSQIKPAQRRRLQHVAALIKAGHESLLSTPTHPAGWLLPTVFAERFNALPASLFYADELGAALYRLPDSRTQRAEAWAQLKLGQLDAVLVDSLTLALAPPNEAATALEQLLARFEKRPPTEPLFYAVSGDTGGSGLLGTLKAKIFQYDPHAVENAAFRLFGAALRCRFGLNDAGVNGRAPKLLERLASARGWFSRMFQESQLCASLLTEFVFAPQPVTEERVAPFSGMWFSAFDQDTSHPCLWPYVLANSQHFAMPQLVIDQVFRFPPLAQRFFEAGLCRQNRKQDDYRDLTVAMLAQAQQPQVDIRPSLGHVTQGLGVTQSAQRENSVDLLAQALFDGRVSPADLAHALAERIQVTEKGYAQLDQALASLGATGQSGHLSVLWALEQVVASGLGGFSPRKQSLLLDRLSGLLEDTGRLISDPTARQVVEQLAAAKNKSVARDKARVLLARSGPVEQLPLAVLAVAALASEPH